MISNFFFLKKICIDYHSEEIGRNKFNSMIGLANHERVDEELYDDFESAKAREVRMLA